MYRGEIIKEEGGITFLNHESDLPSKIRRREVTDNSDSEGNPKC